MGRLYHVLARGEETRWRNDAKAPLVKEIRGRGPGEEVRRVNFIPLAIVQGLNTMLGILDPGATGSDLRKAPWAFHRWIWGVGIAVWVMQLAQASPLIRWMSI